MRRALRGTDLVAHHIIEQRFAQSVNITIAVTREEHQVFTNSWRGEIAYRRWWENYKDVTDARLWEAAQIVYRDHPAIREMVRIALFG